MFKKHDLTHRGKLCAAFLFLTGVLAACGGGEDAASSAGSPAEERIAGTAAEGEWPAGIAAEGERIAGTAAEEWFAGTAAEGEWPADPAAEDLFAGAQEDYGGSLGHGCRPADGRSFTYGGDALSIPYAVTARGKVAEAGVGFLLFLDGIPQPYQIAGPEGETSSYEYMHLLALEDDREKSFSFLFEPVTGKSGETLELQILSVSCMAPDPKGLLPLGTSQSFLEFRAEVAFSCDAALADYGVPQSGGRLLSAAAFSEELTPEAIEAYTDSDMTDVEIDLNTRICTRLFLNGEDVLYKAGGDISRGTVSIRHVILGHPGVRYRTVLYLDYKPLWFMGQNSFLFRLVSGEAGVLEAELDTAGLEGTHILTVISVPCNASDYPEDVITSEPLYVRLDSEERD